MTKIDLITGFLGAGKTTFLKKYADYLLRKGMHIGILENDYGAVNVDMMLLQDLLSDQCELEMVAGGCHRDCHRRRFKSKLIAMGMCGYDRVLIEPSGVFDVDEFFDILHEEPLDAWYEIGNVIAVVDAKMPADLSEDAEYLLASEAANAGCVVMSKTQEASGPEIAAVLSHLNQALEKIHCQRRFSADILTPDTKTSDPVILIPDPKNSDPVISKAGISGTDNSTPGSKGSDIICQNWEQLTDADFERIASCGYVSEDFQKRIVSEEEFSSVYFMNVHMSVDELRTAAEQIFKDQACGSVWRIKGFLQTSGAAESQASKNPDKSGASGAPRIPKSPEALMNPANLPSAKDPKSTHRNSCQKRSRHGLNSTPPARRSPSDRSAPDRRF